MKHKSVWADLEGALWNKYTNFVKIPTGNNGEYKYCRVHSGNCGAYIWYKKTTYYI